MDFGSIGKFEVLGTLGKGAHSAILRVRRRADSKHYALKVVPLDSKDDRKFLDQARHEFRVGGLLDHVNLIKVHALETPRDWLFRVRKVHLLIEYVNGQTLDTMKGLTVPRLVQVFHRIASGLAHMHRRGVCHADLKPNNVMLSRAGDVKIIDYGLAWIKGEAKGRVQGTPEYMAPEQSKHSMVNERTDIYNFGATMYRLVTWRHPPSTLPSPDGLHVDARMFERMLVPIKDCNAEVPKPLGDLIHRCLAFSAHGRPENVTHVKDELATLIDRLVKGPEDRLDAIEW